MGNSQNGISCPVNYLHPLCKLHDNVEDHLIFLLLRLFKKSSKHCFKHFFSLHQGEDK